jgi:hypothetical protein
VSADTLDVIGGIVSLTLTLMVFSYLLGDNPLYRLAVHVLVGTTAGYIAVVAVESVIIPWLDVTLLDDDNDYAFRVLGVLPFLFLLALLVKNSPRYNLLRRFGNIGIAFLIGIGTAVALMGAISGTLIPITRDAGRAFDDEKALNAVLMTVGTIGTLVYFQYLSSRRVDGKVTRSLPMRILAGFGQLILAITFGAIYASAMLTSLNVFDDVISKQLTFLLEQIG